VRAATPACLVLINFMSPLLAVASCVVLSTFELTVHLHSSKPVEDLERRYWSVSTPGDPYYLHFLSMTELAELVGGAPEAVAASSKYLRSLSGRDVRVSPLRDTVTATFDDTQPFAVPGKWSARGLPLATLQPPGVKFVTRRDFNGIGKSGVPATSGHPPRAPAAGSGYDISSQKDAYKIPADRAATNGATTQMVWGPGTFGFSPSELASFKEEQCPGINLDKVKFDTSHHGQEGGDNWMEGTLDTHMISSFGMNSTTLVSNTNTSSSAEEGDGFGLALLDFITGLASRESVPHVLSLSLGSLSPYSCDLLCTEASKSGDVSLEECRDYLQKQRQVCMFMSDAQAGKVCATRRPRRATPTSIKAQRARHRYAAAPPPPPPPPPPH
jgi:hypothetical protein